MCCFFCAGKCLTTPTSTTSFIYPLFPASCHAHTIHQCHPCAWPSTQGPQFAGDVCSQPNQHPASSLPLTWDSPRCFQRLPTEHSAPSPALGPPLVWLLEQIDTPVLQGQEPRQNNGSHLQGRKLHLLHETLSSNKTCLDNSSFITRLFRC